MGLDLCLADFGFGLLRLSFSLGFVCYLNSSLLGFDLPLGLISCFALWFCLIVVSLLVCTLGVCGLLGFVFSFSFRGFIGLLLCVL